MPTDQTAPRHRHASLLVAGSLHGRRALSPRPAVERSPASPTRSGLDHPTGATDVVLRMEEAAASSRSTSRPARPRPSPCTATVASSSSRSSRRSPSPMRTASLAPIPWRTAQLDEGQIEELLTFALGPGGIGTAPRRLHQQRHRRCAEHDLHDRRRRPEEDRRRERDRDGAERRPPTTPPARSFRSSPTDCGISTRAARSRPTPLRPDRLPWHPDRARGRSQRARHYPRRMALEGRDRQPIF